MPRSLGLALLVLLAGATTACGHYHLARGAPAEEEIRSVLLLPLNFDRTPPSSWLDGLDRVAGHVGSLLGSRGRTLERVPLRRTIDAWRAAQRSVGGLQDANGQLDLKKYDAARAELARRLAETSSADVVVMPTVLKSTARSEDGERAEWDGAVRTLRVERDGRSRFVSVQGQFEATSLRVAAFAADGALLFDRTHGLEVMEWVRIRDGDAQVLAREDLFQDDALLASAVDKTFAPFLTAPGS